MLTDLVLSRCHWLMISRAQSTAEKILTQADNIEISSVYVYASLEQGSA